MKNLHALEDVHIELAAGCESKVDALMGKARLKRLHASSGPTASIRSS